MSNTVTLPLTPQTFWALVTIGAILLAVLTTYGLLSAVKPKPDDTPLSRAQTRLGLGALPPGLFVIGGILWGMIFFVLLIGLLWTIISAAFHAPAQTPDAQTALRFILISLTALTATLGAVVAFPVTLIRIALTRQQTKTAEEALFNDKINAAAEGLATQRQVTRIVGRGKEQRVLTEWQDDLVTRASAIDRLEGLAKERPDTAARVARMLSIYVRELSREYPAQDVPEGATPEALRAWAQTLTPIRPDMEKAAQSLGRLLTIPGHDIAPGDIDLRHANLQGFDLKNLRFDYGKFDGASMQGALITDATMHNASFVDASMECVIGWRVKMHRADFGGAKMQEILFSLSEIQDTDFGGTDLQGANLKGAMMQMAKLWGTQLESVDLSETSMQGASFWDAQMDQVTKLSAASLRGAALRSVDETALAQLRPFWSDIFADGTVHLPDDEPRPDHWADQQLSWDDFDTRWHAWQDTLPDFDPAWRRN